MSNARSFIVAMLATLCILGLVATVRPTQHSQRAAFIIVRGPTMQQAESKMPPGAWMLVRRVPNR